MGAISPGSRSHLSSFYRIHLLPTNMLKTKRSYECLEENFDASPSCSPFSMPQPSDSTSPKRKRFRAHAIEPKRVIPASQPRFANPPPYKGELLKQYVARTVEKNASCPPKKAKDLPFSYEDLATFSEEKKQTPSKDMSRR